jgi:hypothetical protein
MDNFSALFGQMRGYGAKVRSFTNPQRVTITFEDGTLEAKIYDAEGSGKTCIVSFGNKVLGLGWRVEYLLGLCEKEGPLVLANQPLPEKYKEPFQEWLLDLHF